MSLLEFIGYAVLAFWCLAVVIFFAGVFNDLVRMRNKVRREFANVEVVLEQRHNEIPRLVEICRAYLRHETEVLESVTALRTRCRSAVDTNSRVAAENALAGTLAALPAVIESYPELQADTQFQRLAGRLGKLETTIADRRELYNQAATHYNTALGQFPQLVVARLLHFESSALFELSDREEAKPPELHLSGAAT